MKSASITTWIVLSVFALGLIAKAVEAAKASSSPSDEFILFVLRKDCWNTFFVEFDLFNVDCLKASISKGLGLGIILGSVVVKLPQIYTIVYNQKFPDTVSIYGELLSSILATVWFRAQGTPFSAYGEVVILVASNILVVLSVWRYKFPGYMHASFFFGAIAVLSGMALSAAQKGVPSMNLTAAEGSVILQYAFNGIFQVSKISQIAAIFSGGSAAAEGLALFSLLLQFAGAAARVFTTAQEVTDVMQLIFSAVNATLNGIVMFQYIFLVTLKSNVEIKDKSIKKKAEPVGKRRKSTSKAE
jgi:mannose-P-dolichol utilization defect protein 1